MEDLEGIIICPKEYKNYFLEEELKSSTFINRTYLTLKEFNDKLFNFLEKSALINTTSYLKTSVETASMYLSKMKYTFITNSDNDKIKKVLDIRKHLEDTGYICGDPYFKKLLKSSKIYVIGYPRTKELNLTMKYVEKFSSICYLEENFICHEIPSILEFNKLKDENTYVFTEISKLIDKGVSPSKIKIVNLKENYFFYSNILINKLDLPITNLDNKNIAITTTAKKFLEKCLTYKDFESIIDEFSNKNSYVLEKIINIINSYKVPNMLPKDFIPFLTYELKKTSYENQHFLEEVEIVSLTNLKNDPNTYYFVMSFDNDNSYKISKDNDYLSDSEKETLGLDTSSELTNISRLETIKKLKSLNNLVISYKLSSPFSTFNKTNLIKELDLNIIKPEKPILYSDFLDSILLSEELDNLLKYNEQSPLLEKLYYKNFKFRTYDNRFKGLDRNIYNELKDETTLLSYSAIDKFFNCPFKYYLGRVLKIDEFTSSLATELGNFAHETLEHSYDKSFDIDKVEIPSCSLMESVYYKKVLKHVKDIYEFNKKMEARTTFTHTLPESNIKLKFPEYSMEFVGKIDKVLYNDLNEAMIIDYKTGSVPFDLDNFKHGIHTQLPIYYYMLRKSGKIEKPSMVGLYLQYIKIANYKYDESVSISEQQEKSMLLNGYTSKSKAAQIALDSNESNTLDLGKYAYVSGVQLKNDGDFKAFSKVCDDADFDSMYNITDNLIKDAITKINNASFDIAPKEIDNNLFGCKYCSFKDVCFVTFKDHNRLKKDPFFVKSKADQTAREDD